jgi:hypothetical protein
MDFLAQVVIWLNAVANALGRWLLAPIGVLPGWLSATIVSAVTGVFFLIVFKYTSNQRAIKRVKDDIKANLLALKLFKDSALVALSAQGRVLLGAFWLLVFAVVPMLVMLVPVLLILGQLALWYQSRPLKVGEEVLLALNLSGDVASPLPDVRLEPTNAVETTIGPVRVPTKRAIFWEIKAREPGYHRLVFQVGDQTGDKQVAIGDGFMRVSPLRPGMSWWDSLLNPWEEPFDPRSGIKSIEIEYPERDSWTSGTDWWVLYWFGVSMIAGLCLRRPLNVNF